MDTSNCVHQSVLTQSGAKVTFAVSFVRDSRQYLILYEHLMVPTYEYYDINKI